MKRFTFTLIQSDGKTVTTEINAEDTGHAWLNVAATYWNRELIKKVKSIVLDSVEKL